MGVTVRGAGNVPGLEDVGNVPAISGLKEGGAEAGMLMIAGPVEGLLGLGKIGCGECFGTRNA
jgi:hypothetical protein